MANVESLVVRKYRALDFIGVCDGIYYFRDAGSKSGSAYKGDEEDYQAWQKANSEPASIAPIQVAS
jgi:hypothetical protein